MQASGNKANCLVNCVETGTAEVRESMAAVHQTTDDGDAADAASRCISLKEQTDVVLKRPMQLLQPGAGQTLGTLAKKRLDKAVATAITSEMAIFESKDVRRRSLELLYNYLLSIPPASVESDRTFSAAGSLCSKVRSRFDDCWLDVLCIVRSFYKQKTGKHHNN